MKIVRRNALVLILILLFAAGRSVNKNYKLALKLFHRGEYSTALNKVDMAIAQDKTSQAMWLKGHILAAMENYNRAIFFLGYQLRQGCEPDDNLIALGDSYYELANYDQAKNCYRKVKELSMRNFYNLGATYFRLNDNDSAVYYLSKAIEMDSGKALAYFGRATIFNDELRMDCACRDYQKACDLGSTIACLQLEKQNCLSWKSVWQNTLINKDQLASTR